MKNNVLCLDIKVNIVKLPYKPVWQRVLAEKGGKTYGVL